MNNKTRRRLNRQNKRTRDTTRGAKGGSSHESRRFAALNRKRALAALDPSEGFCAYPFCPPGCH